MSEATALEAIGKVFTGEVLDIILREGLIDYYDVISHFQTEEVLKCKTKGGMGFPSVDYVHNEEIQKALTVVIQDFMTEGEFVEWLKERKY